MTKPQDMTERAVQIVSIGSKADGYAFRFDKEALDSILQKVPQGASLASVSVVGALRSGKSSLLSWLLKYLKLGCSVKRPLCDVVKKFESHDGFHWKSGAERHTTGIWMWSHPIMRVDTDGSSLAILLIDTQGMFDHETPMDLTVAIFGFTTLISSYLIYNVDKRIQEDNWQHLAYFSEYAKLAAESESKDKNTTKTPFKHLEFLIRDWQNFTSGDLSIMEDEAQKYLQTTMDAHGIKDNEDARTHISRCFERITCFALSHPGLAATDQAFSGDVSLMESRFCELLNRYCDRVFATVAKKKINGFALTATDFGNCCDAYAKLFVNATKFPPPGPLLEVAAALNNMKAREEALDYYKARMDEIVGEYVPTDVLEEKESSIRRQSLKLFDDLANFGSYESKEKIRNNLEMVLLKKQSEYFNSNEQLAKTNLQMYMLVLSACAGIAMGRSNGRR